METTFFKLSHHFLLSRLQSFDFC